MVCENFVFLFDEEEFRWLPLNRQLRFPPSLGLQESLWCGCREDGLAPLSALCTATFAPTDAGISGRTMVSWPGSWQTFQLGLVKAGKVENELGVYQVFAD